MSAVIFSYKYRLTIKGPFGEATKRLKTQADGQVSYLPAPVYTGFANTGPALAMALQHVCDIFDLLSKWQRIRSIQNGEACCRLSGKRNLFGTMDTPINGLLCQGVRVQYHWNRPMAI